MDYKYKVRNNRNEILTFEDLRGIGKSNPERSPWEFVGIQPAGAYFLHSYLDGVVDDDVDELFEVFRVEDGRVLTDSITVYVKKEDELWPVIMVHWKKWESCENFECERCDVCYVPADIAGSFGLI